MDIPVFVNDSNGFVSDADMNIEVMTQLSLSHIYMAKKYADIAKSLDKPDLFKNHNTSLPLRGYCISAVILSTAFLEATINEIYCDINEYINKTRYFSLLKNQNSEKLKSIAKLWNYKIPRTASYPILMKYNLLLDMLDLSKIDKGTLPYQNVDLLIMLRNQLIHFESEWNDIDIQAVNKKASTTSTKFQQKLSGKFAENQIYKKSNMPFFPDKCLGAGCAIWAVESSIAFTDVFYSNIGILPSYDSIRKDISF